MCPGLAEPQAATARDLTGEPAHDGMDLPDWIRMDPERPFLSRESEIAQFPIGIWRRLANRVLAETDFAFFHDADPAGHHGLRQHVARYLGFARGIRCGPDDIVITTGTRHSLDLCLRALAKPGDAVWLESPGYAGAAALVQAQGLTPVPVPVDLQDLKVDAGVAEAPDARLCIVTPSQQSPLGVRLGIERRVELLDWASRVGAYIVKDD